MACYAYSVLTPWLGSVYSGFGSETRLSKESKQHLPTAVARACIEFLDSMSRINSCQLSASDVEIITGIRISAQHCGRTSLCQCMPLVARASPHHGLQGILKKNDGETRSYNLIRRTGPARFATVEKCPD